MSGHAHNYQRYTRLTGGGSSYVDRYGRDFAAESPGCHHQPADDSHETTFDAAIASLGYLYMTARQGTEISLWPLTDTAHSGL